MKDVITIELSSHIRTREQSASFDINLQYKPRFRKVRHLLRISLLLSELIWDEPCRYRLRCCYALVRAACWYGARTLC